MPTMEEIPVGPPVPIVERCAQCGVSRVPLLSCDDPDVRTTKTPKPKYCNNCMIGKKVRVFWPVDESWYTGTVQEFDATTKEHLLRYSDGDTEWVKIGEQTGQDVGGGSGGGGGAGVGEAQPPPPPPGPPQPPPDGHHHHHHHHQPQQQQQQQQQGLDPIPHMGAPPADHHPGEAYRGDGAMPPHVDPRKWQGGGGGGDPQQQQQQPPPPPPPPPPMRPDNRYGGGPPPYHHSGEVFPPYSAGSMGQGIPPPHPPPPYHGVYPPYGNPMFHNPYGGGGGSQPMDNGKGGGDNGSIASESMGGRRKAGHKAWSKEEDALLLSLVQNMQMPMKWSLVAQSLPDRTGKQCRERYVNHLNPRLKATDWTPVEDTTIFHLYNTIGSHWAKMSKVIPGRTDNGIKNRFHNLRRQFEREDEHRLRLSSAKDFPGEIRLDRCRRFPNHLKGRSDSLWDMKSGIGVLAAQSILGDSNGRSNGNRFGPFREVSSEALSCVRCGFLMPSIHTGGRVCTRTGWCETCTRIPPHVSSNLLRECLNLRRAQNKQKRQIIESWEEYFSKGPGDDDDDDEDEDDNNNKNADDRGKQGEVNKARGDDKMDSAAHQAGENDASVNHHHHHPKAENNANSQVKVDAR